MCKSQNQKCLFVVPSPSVESVDCPTASALDSAALTKISADKTMDTSPSNETENWSCTCVSYMGGQAAEPLVPFCLANPNICRIELKGGQEQIKVRQQAWYDVQIPSTGYYKIYAKLCFLAADYRLDFGLKMSVSDKVFPISVRSGDSEKGLGFLALHGGSQSFMVTVPYGIMLEYFHLEL